MKWACGITSVLDRSELLMRTQRSLRGAGFDEPLLRYDFGRVGPWGNWILCLHEVCLRNPFVDRYVMFQDDVIVVKNLRGYLDQQRYPDAGYWNLYTAPSNQDHIEGLGGGTGFHQSNQLGKGALALVFDRETLRKLRAAS